MTFLFKLIGLVALVAIAAGVVFAADMVWNESRLFYAAVGRDALVRDCTPGTKEALIGKGFSPIDLSFESRPSIGVSYGTEGRVRTFRSAFTFSDGQGGLRIDGRLACMVHGHDIQVDVDVDSLPRRLT